VRAFRFVVVAALVAGGLMLLASGAQATVSAASKGCKTLVTLNKELQKFQPSNDEFDAQSLRGIAGAFRKAARSAPKQLKSAMNTFATVYADVANADNRGDALARFAENAKKYGQATKTWTTYYTKNCTAGVG
jgi:hypothetical protein